MRCSSTPPARWPNVDAFKAELLRLASSVTIRAAGLTDVGMVRELNEDAVMTVEYLARFADRSGATSYLYVIADGMGGAEAGEIASAIAVGAIRELRRAAASARSPAARSASFCRTRWKTANRQILDYAGSPSRSAGHGFDRPLAP